MNNVKLAVCDTETTGLVRPKPPASGVVQVAAVILNSATLEIESEQMEYVDPGCPIEPGAAKVHGITEDMVAGKPNLETAFGWDEPTLFIAHNAKFDLPRLSPCLPNVVGVLCTYEAARRYVKGSENHKLVTLTNHFGLPLLDAHDALGDVKMTRNLLVKLLEITGLTIWEMQKDLQKVKMPLEMPFGKHKGKKFTEIPIGYIDYMLGLPDVDSNVRKALEMQKKARGLV